MSSGIITIDLGYAKARVDLDGDELHLSIDGRVLVAAVVKNGTVRVEAVQIVNIPPDAVEFECAGRLCDGDEFQGTINLKTGESKAFYTKRKGD